MCSIVLRAVWFGLHTLRQSQVVGTAIHGVVYLKEVQHHTLVTTFDGSGAVKRSQNGLLADS